MVIGNGVTVHLKDANGIALQEAASESQEPRSFRYRLITAPSGARFTVSVTVEERFQWKGADALFIAIAYDDGVEEHLQNCGVTQAWAISQNGAYQGEHNFKAVATWDSDEAGLQKASYSMPDAVDHARQIDFDPARHRAKDTLVSHRGCVSVYVHRGRLSLQANKRRPADPPVAIQNKLSFEKHPRARINFESFAPLQPLTGNVCEFHFRNVSPIHFGQVLTPAPSNHSAKETSSAASMSDDRGSLDPAIARTSKGLRGLQQVNYSVSETYARQGFPWNEGNASSGVPGQGQKRGRPSSESVSSQLHEGQKRQRAMTVSDEDDEDDEEIIVSAPRDATKSESLLGDPEPVEAKQQPRPVEATTSTAVNGQDKSEQSTERRELEMELEEIELDKKALQIKRRLLKLV